MRLSYLGWWIEPVVGQKAGSDFCLGGHQMSKEKSTQSLYP